MFRIPILGVICFLMSFFTNAQTTVKNNSSIKLAVQNIKNDNGLKNANISFYAIDIKTNEVLAEINPDMSVRPASVQKLISSATALEVLGSDYQFKTELYFYGNIDTSARVLYGGIIIKGGGDPSLGSKYFDTLKNYAFRDIWYKAIIQLNIDSITDGVIGDETIYGFDMVPPTWAWEDMANYFGAGACGLTIFDNRYNLIYRTGNKSGAPTKILRMEPEIPGMTFENKVISANTNSDDSYIFGAPYSYSRYTRGKLPLNKNEYEVGGSMPDPCFFAAFSFQEFAESKGLKFGKKPTTRRLLGLNDSIFMKKQLCIASTLSPKLSEIVYQCNMKSINLFAEHFLIHTHLKLTSGNDIKDACETIENFWKEKGMNTDGISINDGSGLSQYNNVTARQIVFVLQYMKTKSANNVQFYNSLPIAGVSGTLKNVCKGSIAENNLKAKSGSIRRVRSYAGYVTSKSGREICFCAILNNFSGSSTNAKTKLEKLMISLAEYND